MSNRATEILKSRSATPARLPDFPEVMDSIAALDIQDAIIDGEIVALDEKGRSSFQLLQSLDMGKEAATTVFLRI
jgi:ATP-dependent DNA ligase